MNIKDEVLHVQYHQYIYLLEEIYLLDLGQMVYLIYYLENEYNTKMSQQKYLRVSVSLNAFLFVFGQIIFLQLSLFSKAFPLPSKFTSYGNKTGNSDLSKTL